VASWLVRPTTDRAVWVRALAEDIFLCSWERLLTLTAPLSTQTSEFNLMQQTHNWCLSFSKAVLHTQLLCSLSNEIYLGYKLKTNKAE